MKKNKEYVFLLKDDGTMTEILTEEQIKERKIATIERKKKELDKEFDPYYVPSTQACMPDEYKTLSNNPYIKFGSRSYFETDEDVAYDKE